MRKLIVAIICLSLLAIPASALAGKKPLSARLENASMSFRNNTDHNIDLFIHVHAWGCGTPEQRLEKITFEDGVDINGKQFKNSFFVKLAKFDHYILPPGEWVIVWTWPGSMRCVGNNEEVQFTMKKFSFHPKDRIGFFNYFQKFK